MKNFWTLGVVFLAAVAFAACKSDGNTPEAGPSGGNVATNMPADGNAPAGGGMAMMDPTPEADKLWEVAKDYTTWTSKSDAPTAAEKPHGAFVRVFYNQTAADAAGSEGEWPVGTIIAKENFMPNPEDMTAPGMLGAITVMERRKAGEGGWFWAKFKPDGSLHTMEMDGMEVKVAGMAKLKCIGCHESKQTRDLVVTPLP